MDPREYPILEFDPEPEAVINPAPFYRDVNAPEICIYPFYKHVLNDLEKRQTLTQLTTEKSLVTDPLPLYTFIHQGVKLAAVTPGLGAPFAVAMLECAIASGCRKYIVVGSCGVLDSAIPRDKLILPTHAIRDEGTSYHYCPPAREIEIDPLMQKVIKGHLEAHDIGYIEGKTWTTDAFYRETPAVVQARKLEGAIAVEMEAAALAAAAAFRGVSLGYLLAAGDDVSGLEWDHRGLMDSLSFHERFFWLAADIAAALAKKAPIS